MSELLAMVCPDAPAEIRAAWLSKGAVRIGGDWVGGRDLVVEPGRIVHVEIEGAGPGAGDARSENLRFDPALWPRLRARASGARVWTPASPFRRGRLEVARAGEGHAPFGVMFEVVAERAGLSCLRLEFEADAALEGVDEPVAFETACAVLEGLSRVGLCVLGDPFFGGPVSSGGLAWQTWVEGAERGAESENESDSLFDDLDPGAGVFVESPDGETRPSWRVSDATARVLGRGHPWIRLDTETGDPAAFAPGQRVDLVTGDGQVHGQALVEGAGRGGLHSLGDGAVAGRVIGSGTGGDWSIEACVASALAKRARWLDARDATDAFRLIHGEADGLPGLQVDRLGSLIRVLVTARCALPMVDRVLVALGAGGERVIPNPWRIIEVIHLDERLPAGLERVRVHPYSADPVGAAEHGCRTTVREAGLVYTVEPGLGEPDRSAPGFGLFLDQRENRAAFVKGARKGGRYLNLFAHTGAFSVALLAAGAEQVLSVDLSASYLRWLEGNLEANAASGVDLARHVSVRQDGRRYLERLEPGDCFDGIVLDPPTAAAAGRRFFSVRKDAVPMIADCLAHLVPGGQLLVTLNDRKARRKLKEAVVEAGVEAGIELSDVRPARPSGDFPRVGGFDEGDPFVGFLVRR